MKILVVALFGLLFLPSVALGDDAREKALHDMHMMMRFMDHGLCVALEGADLQMLGQMGMSEKLDRDAIVHGTIMVNDGKGIIKEMLEGKAMQQLYKEGNFDKETMEELHNLGEKMLEVIEQIEKIHKSLFKQSSIEEF